ncbi:hypothetical protein NL529_29410, partial [Klebsiella pneumoniae]|nr:hypothetical protein [Klebsiella pneumoniae]
GGGFVGQPSFSYVSGTSNGQPFLIGALFCASVTTIATNPSDTAFYYSYSGDTFTGDINGAVLTGSAAEFATFSTFVSQASGFQNVSVI